MINVNVTDDIPSAYFCQTQPLQYFSDYLSIKFCQNVNYDATQTVDLRQKNDMALFAPSHVHLI